jgi:cold-inducible RNA-binding protein
MATKLYVGNLSYSTTQERLQEIFSQAGTVASAVVITDKFSGRSKGFGFVEMSAEDEAQKAVEMYNGYELDGRKLIVNEARPMTERKPRFSGGGYQRGGGSGGGYGRQQRDEY